MSLSCKWSLLSCDSCLIDCRKYRYNHAPCKEAECLHFTSFWWQVVSVVSVLVSVTCAECTRPPAPNVISLFHSLVLPLLSGGYFLDISSAARGLCCLRRSVDIFPGLSINQASCLLIASKCSNSEPAGPGQNACPSSSAVGSSKRVTISFSRYYLVARPFTGAINCLQSWRRQRSSSSSSWHPRTRSVASSREVERRRTGRSGWRISYRCVLLSICVHHSPKTTQKTSENWKRLSYNKPLQTGRWTSCDRGGRPMPSASPFFTLVVTGNRACETRLSERTDASWCERCCAAPRVMERHGAKWCDAYIVNTHAYTVNQALTIERPANV